MNLSDTDQAPYSAPVNTGGAAFPQFEVVAGERDGHGDAIDVYTVAKGGMTLRDYIAARKNAFPSSIPQDYAEALCGRPLPQAPKKGTGNKEATLQVIHFWAEAEARYRFIMADAMLAAREVRT